MIIEDELLRKSKLEEKLKTLFPNYTSATEKRFRFVPIISVNTPYRYRTYSMLGNVLRLGKKVLERDEMFINLCYTDNCSIM